jgi:hypothetical protein
MLLEAIKEELESLVIDGSLDPERVVDAARNPNSSMHGQFNWDDTEAAHQYRISQARALIKRVKVNVIRADDTVVRVSSYIRSASGAGYESTQQVAVNYGDRVTVMLITLASCATMLRNLAAPEVDDIIDQIQELRQHLLSEREEVA